MNLVQINERLKEMPLQAVQRYANGMNPEIPPYLALGELQRRETMHKQAATAQGAAMGPQPSVKEQIEQKAGLMALQQQQAQQAQQQMMQTRPGPVPANVPQPEDQPELAMASGGIARLPVRSGMFDFASGGIIAFNGKTDGSEVDSEEAKKKKLRHYTLQEQGADWVARKEAERNSQNESDNYELPPVDPEKVPKLGRAALAAADVLTLPARGIMGIINTAGVRPLRAMGADVPYIPEKLFGGDSSSMTPYYDKLRRAENRFKSDQEREKNMAIVRAEGENLRPTMANDPRLLGTTPPDQTVQPAPMGNVKTTRPTIPPAAAPAVAANAAKQEAAPADANLGIAGLNDPAFMEAAKRAIAEPKQEQGISDYKARMAAMGLGEPYGKDQEARINELNAQYQKGLENRGLERLMRVLQARNMGEYGSRYLGAVEQERAADLAQAAKMNELLSSLEGKRREEGMTGVKTIGEEMDRRRQLAGQTAASLSGSQMQAGVSRANQLSQNATSLKIAELDRQLRERLHNTPAAQKLSVEEQAIEEYVKAGLTRTQAFEKVKTVGASGDRQNLAELKALQSSLKERALTDKDAAKLLRDVEAKIAAMAGVGGSATLPAGFKLD